MKLTQSCRLLAAKMHYFPTENSLIIIPIPGLSIEAGSRRKSAVYGGFKCRLLHWQKYKFKKKKISFSNVYRQPRDVFSQSRGHDKQGWKVSVYLPWAKYSSHEFRSLIGCLFKVRMHRFFSKITRETFRWSLNDNNRDVLMVINSLVLAFITWRQSNRMTILCYGI